jgi:hypothetical protein
MDPSYYYYGAFRTDFNAFWQSLEVAGSSSRARAHQRQNFWGHRLASAISGTLNADGGYFSVGDLVASDRGLPDHFANIPREHHPNFLCALFYTVLIDQAMYTHCRADYAVFRALTQYPKVDRTVGWAGALTMANPYEILGDDVLVSRGLSIGNVRVTFERWAQFIVADLRNFFAKHTVGATTWPTVREAMLSDGDCTWGQLGSYLQARLIEDRAAAS